jgi:hypothetical protein
MKYEIIKNGIDDYTLKYKEKEIKFNSNVDLVTEMQEVNEKARENLIFDLASRNMTINDLVKKQIIDGKTYYDNSNKEELEKIYIEKETSKVFMKTIKKMLGMDFTELALDIGLSEENEMKKFGEEMGEILIGRFQNKGQK